MAEQTTDIELWLERSARRDILENLQLMEILLLSLDSDKRGPYESWRSGGIFFVRRNDSVGRDLTLVLSSEKAISDFFTVVRKECGPSAEDWEELLIEYPVLSELENL